MSENITIKHLAEEDRPREKMMLKGRNALSNAELIAILIGSGNKNETAVDLAQRILSAYQNDLHKLGKIQIQDFMQFKGIGEAKAISIIAALELGRRRQITDVEIKKTIRNSVDLFEVFDPNLSDLNHEEFWVIYLNKANKIIHKEKLSSGGITGTVVDIKLLLKNAVQHLASSIALCHNHPSGNLVPSDADIQLTKKIKEAGKLFDIILLDHLIIGDKNYYSFQDEGLL